MSVNEIIEGCLSGIVEDIWPMVCPEESKPSEYAVYNPEVTLPDDFCDNEPLSWVSYMQVHFFCRGDFLEKEKKIRKALRKAGFLISGITTMYEKDSGYNHTCISCSIEEAEE